MGPPKLGQLVLAMQSPFDSIPSSTSLVGDSLDSWSQMFSMQLAKKLKKPCYVSCSLPINSPQFQAFAQRRLLQELQEKT